MHDHNEERAVDALVNGLVTDDRKQGAHGQQQHQHHNQQTTIHSMGFDPHLVARALQQFRGDEQQAVDALLSGRVLLTGSAEVARPISAQYPSVWWAAFVDAGNAADNWRDMDPVLGYGLGLRWRSPVGPLRLDLAYGEAVRKARLHFSVGISF